MPYGWTDSKFGRRYVRYTDTPPAPVTNPEEVIGSKPLELADWTKADLVELAKDRGLPTSGTKADLLERLGPA